MRAAIKTTLAQVLFGEERYAEEFTVSPVGGGSINAAYKVSRGSNTFFVKVNKAARHPLMFELEAKGLKALGETGAFRTPQVLGIGYADDEAFLVLEWIESGKHEPSSWENFGHALALLHKHTNKRFGWEDDNYIGSLSQSNGHMRKWADFYIINRLDAQVELAFNAGLLGRDHMSLFNKLYPKLEQLIPQEPPALIHGDLWSGNFMVAAAGEPVLIDPAVYYGHREMDLGMMQLFGGFDAEVFRAYHANFPLEKNWEERIPLHQLYPLLVHVNLFGGGYVSLVERAIKPFI